MRIQEEQKQTVAWELILIMARETLTLTHTWVIYIYYIYLADTFIWSLLQMSNDTIQAIQYK